MNKKVIISICIGIIVIALIIFVWNKCKTNSIIFEQELSENYAYIVYNGKEYVPYSAISSTNRGKYLGYVKDNEAEKVYKFKDYSQYEWLISYSNGEGMLYKEKNVTDIPEGISSEYEWNKLSDLDKFYNNEATKKYKDIRELGEDYNKEQAQLDNCFVVGAMVHNDNLYTEFMKKYNNKETAFIRVGQNTVEGDLCIIDLLYNANENKIYLVKDNTRDKFASSEDRTIKLKEYEHTGELKYNGNLYWVVYNGELDKNSTEEYIFDSELLYIIVTIN